MEGGKEKRQEGEWEDEWKLKVAPGCIERIICNIGIQE